MMMFDTVTSSNSTKLPLYITTACTSACSIVGCSFVLFVLIFARKDYRWYVWKSVFGFCLSALILSGCLLWHSLYGLVANSPSSGVVCTTGGFIIIFSINLSTAYMILVTISIFQLMKGSSERSCMFESILHVAIWIFPITLAVLPLLKIGGIYYSGNTGWWCYVDSSFTKYVRVTFSYFFAWIGFFPVSMICILMVRYIRDRERADTAIVDQKEKHRLTMFRQMILFPFCWLILWVPGTINKLFYVIGFDVFALNFIEALGFPLQGAAQAIIFVFISAKIDKANELVATSRYENPLQYKKLVSIVQLDEPSSDPLVIVNKNNET